MIVNYLATDVFLHIRQGITILTLRFLVLQGSQAMELCAEDSLLRPLPLRTFSAMNLGYHGNRFPGLSHR